MLKYNELIRKGLFYNVLSLTFINLRGDHLTWRKYSKSLFVPIRKASRDYGLIEENDAILVALSGGKDSLILLYAMAILQKTLPCKFNLAALCLDMGFKNDYSKVKTLCDNLEVPFHVIPSQIAQIIFEERQEKNPCSLCARFRRGAINNWAHEHDYNKVALGHHLDDVLETFLMSLFYEGRLNTFAPKSYLDRSQVTVIRPMIYVLENDIKKIASQLELPIVVNNCPANGKTTREQEKQLIKDLSKDNPALRHRMMSAITNKLWVDYKLIN